MEKEDAVKLLIEQGYNAELTDGVVIAYIPPETDADSFDRKVCKVLRNSGYRASYGVRIGKGEKNDELRAH